MKLYELINEDQYSPKSVFKDDSHAVQEALKKGKKIVALLKQKSTPWLKQTSMGKYHVFRGFEKNPHHTAFIKKVRKNRKPKDSGKDSHKAYDFLIKLCKKKANRSNAVFVSGDQYVADNYGKEYIVMPIGDFTYTWHEDHGDWHMDIPWQDVLVKKDPEVKGKKALTKETKWAQDWQEKYDNAAKQVGMDKAYVQKFFSQLGITVQPKQFLSLARNLGDLFREPKGNASFNAGSPSNPFPNVADHRPPEYQSWYGANDKVKLGAMKKVYEILITADAAHKAKIRKALVMIKNRLQKARKAMSFMKHHPNPKEYIAYQKEQLKHGSGHSGGNERSFKIGKDKVSQLDPDYYEAWCKGLHGDDGTLIAGIKTENEIMISCNSVIAIDPGFYDEIVLPMLQGKKPKLSSDRAQELLDPRRDDW